MAKFSVVDGARYTCMEWPYEPHQSQTDEDALDEKYRLSLKSDPYQRVRGLADPGLRDPTLPFSQTTDLVGFVRRHFVGE